MDSSLGSNKPNLEAEPTHKIGFVLEVFVRFAACNIGKSN